MQNRKMQAIQKSQRLFDQDRSQVRPCKKSQEILRQKVKRDGAKAVQPLHERYKKVMQDKEMKIDALRQVQLEDEIDKDPDNFAPSFKPDT